MGTFDIICDTNYQCSQIYDPVLGYYYKNKSRYLQTNIRDRGDYFGEYNFWDIFKSNIANFLNPEWLGYLEDQSDIFINERTLYFYKGCKYRWCTNCEYNGYENNLSFIHSIYYGTLFKIILPDDVDKVEIKHHVLKDSEPYKFHGKCTVVVNNREKREMNINDMITFVKTYQETYRCYKIELGGQVSTQVKIINKKLLLSFLENLYLCYRRIENRLKKVGCEYHPDSELPRLSIYDYVKIIDQLNESMHDYRNMDVYNVVQMHKIMKRLFHAFKTYLEHCMENRKDITGGEITSEMVNDLRILNKKLDMNKFNTINTGTSSHKLEHSFVSISSYGINAENFETNLQEKTRVMGYIRMLDFYIGVVENKLFDSGLKVIPWYEITPVEDDDLIGQYTIELREVKDQNVIKIYPVIVKLYQSYCSFIGKSLAEKQDLSSYLEEATLRSLIDKLENWTVIYCDNFILSEPNGWYTFYKEFKPLNSKLKKENEKTFIEFLIHLYKFYTKIEVKLMEAKYDKIYQHESDPSFTYRTVCIELDKGIKVYKSGMELLSKENNDCLLAVYPLVKKLYCCYTKYLSYCTENEIKIDEGVHLPGTSEKLKEWIEKLDSWSLKKVGDEWQEFVETKREKDEEREKAKSDIKDMIMNQLKKHQNQHDDVKNKKITAIIEMMNNFKEKTEVIYFLLKEIKDLNLDGDTNELIDKFNQT